MGLVFHPEVFSDIDKIMSYYERIANRELANDFGAEVRRGFVEAGARPELFAIREHGLRRANLRRFPYQFLFRNAGQEVRILVVRHHHRHPSIGLERR